MTKLFGFFLGWEIGAKRVLREWGFGFDLGLYLGVPDKSIIHYLHAKEKL